MSAGERELPPESEPQENVDNLLVGSDQFLVFDRDQATAWLQSDTILEVER